jgi:hypothetical protein
MTFRMDGRSTRAVATSLLPQVAFRHFSEMPAKNYFMTSLPGKPCFRSTTLNSPPRSYPT